MVLLIDEQGLWNYKETSQRPLEEGNMILGKTSSEVGRFRPFRDACGARSAPTSHDLRCMEGPNGLPAHALIRSRHLNEAMAA